ncbi:hypothetical protein KZ686_22155 [Cupriavidus cauae]|uniref:hypothetical protein n=1 Tax=Cupriavidus cauae TaxID=2608999 RepID=UPI0022448776|nr:hypothetical protein [Cupriavidus cauae]UZN51065.1 hypothetical protein KZ686_22155 [Cupriavidus cauae]
MTGTPTAFSTAISPAVADNRLPFEADTIAPGNPATMAVQAGGSAVRVRCHSLPTRQFPSRSSADRVSGAWQAVVSLLNRRNAQATMKRCASSEWPTAPDKPRRSDGDICPAAADPPPQAAPRQRASPSLLLELPFELLCEVLARVPAGDRYFAFGGSPLSATCRSFHLACNTISAMPQYRDEDAIARRIAGMRHSDQILSTTEALTTQPPSIREWAMKAVVSMTRAMPPEDRRCLVVEALEQARQHSESWALELMRYFARWIPYGDTPSLDMLTESAVRLVPGNDEIRFARARVLAQLAQRIDPADLPGSVRRWETIYQAIPPDARHEDYVALRALRQALSHLSNDFQAAFTMGDPTDLLIGLLSRLAKTRAAGPEPCMAACSDEELDLLPPPLSDPGRRPGPPPDRLRAYAGVKPKAIPHADRLPAHIP